ncbi:hypothetical protein RKE29_14540 [Streptomyces sp. B1866]|uniref:hypothetical protein n=1 Tax=Streptomyces sp. B1866 TaxID=3075431 RepID=UPI002890E91D|nr:hypothetical protein [Streptomyces sp. B1866]MDT3397848.1 hypothetical protein [Streptomyces sp. B1866]
MPEHIPTAQPAETAEAAEPESLAQLRGDCARMAPHWTAAARVAPAGGRPAPARGTGITVPPASARLLDGMSDYGD